jgi:hypothetical protein
MSSRKTYFGIGWPKDPTDPDPGVPGKSDAEDRSAPTVVDDEKVAEGLRQLRTWYKSDETRIGNPMDEGPKPTAAPAPAGPGARPTAVGHATGPPPAVQQRPAVPDPMRATQYGHNVHQFDFDAAAASATAPAPPAESTALVVANRELPAYPQQAEAVPAPIGGSPSGSFGPALHGAGQAERLQRPGGANRSASYAAPRVSPVPIASRVVLGIGIAALAGAIVLRLAGTGSESPADSPQVGSTTPAPASPPVPAPPMPALPPAPAAAALPAAPAAVPARTASVPARSLAAPSPRPTAAPPAPSPRPTAAPPAAVPVPLVGEPKAVSAPMVLKAPRRQRQPKPEAPASPTEVDEAPVTDKQTSQSVTSPGDRTATEAKDTKDVKAAKDVKGAKPAPEAKPTPEARPASEAKAATETKPASDAKAAAEAKAAKAAAEAKAARSRLREADATLPPSD